MKTVFELGFRKDVWMPSAGLGGPSLAQDILPQLITSAGAGFGAYEQTQVAEEQKKAEQAKAAAAQAQAATASAQARTAEAIGGSKLVPYLIVGGIGLAVVAVVIAVTR
jgi:hypothetical protein